ncbi:unnamed protein product [Paramecium primaurelia]|uniref:Uncharacterized protein n=1 Tax=Paramecium primaurelia TaxID=5886 RepID=A0A8S1PS96_PARPR|nr:unnamed protein product [Paramecium primaurelia]
MEAYILLIQHHKKTFYKLIEQLGFYFFQKPSSIYMQNDQASENIKKKNEAFKKSESFMQEQNELDILSKYEAIVPELTHDNIAILINLFNDQRVLSINHNYLAIQDISIIKNIDEIINKFQININYINQQNDRIWQQHINM